MKRIRKETVAFSSRIMAASFAMVLAFSPLGAYSNAGAEKETVQAAAAYPSKYTQTVKMEELIKPALLNQWNNSDNMYEQLEQMLLYKTINQGNILTLSQQGVKFPAESLKKLAAEGLISGYLYKLISGLPYETSDFKDVFDASYYYAANPDIQGVVSNDEQALFNDFLTNGMAAGRAGSATFNPAYLKANYPALAVNLGDNNMNYYVYYIIYGKDNMMIADRLLK